MKQTIIILSIVFNALPAFSQLKLDLSDSTTYLPGYETSFDINYQDTFVYLDSNTSKTFETIEGFHKKHPTFVLELGVHQDHLGSENFNLRQSEARAKRIIELLHKSYDVDISKFIVIGYGESKPIIDIKKVDKSRFENDIDLFHNVTNLNRRLSLKILSIR